MPRFELHHSATDREWNCATPQQVFAVLNHYREIRSEILVIENADGNLYGAYGDDWYAMNITGYAYPPDNPWLYPATANWNDALPEMETLT